MSATGAFEISFPAIRGIQAGREYYSAMCPLETVVRLIRLDFDNEALPPQLRAQRVLNKSRVPAIARYMLDNTDTYVFSSLTVSVNKEVKFAPVERSGNSNKLGILSVPYDAMFLINDGQHRRAAIEVALQERPELRHESISVV